MIYDEARFSYGPSQGRVIAVGGGALVLSALLSLAWLGGAGAMALVAAGFLAVGGLMALILYRPGFRRSGALVLGSDDLRVIPSMGRDRLEAVGYETILDLRVRNDKLGNRLEIRHLGGMLTLYRDFFDSGRAFDGFLDALNERLDRLPPTA